MPSSRGSSQPRDGTHVFCISCSVRILYHCAALSAGCLLGKPLRALVRTNCCNQTIRESNNVWRLKHNVILFHTHMVIPSRCPGCVGVSSLARSSPGIQSSFVLNLLSCTVWPLSLTKWQKQKEYGAGCEGGFKSENSKQWLAFIFHLLELGRIVMSSCKGSLEVPLLCS